MAKQPAAAKARSAAQIAAGRKFAAAGRAAQARRGANRTPAQKQATLKFAAAGRAAQAARRRGKKVPAAKQARALAQVSLEVSGELPRKPAPSLEVRLTFGNDALPNCTAAAIATHLYLSTGLLASDTEVAQWHEAAGGVIDDVLAYLSNRIRGGARLAAFWPLAEGPALAGAVTGVRWPQGRHTVLALSRDRCLSWGIHLPLTGEIEESWWLEWEAGPAERATDGFILL